MATTRTDQRKQIGRRLAKGELRAWVVPFRQGGSIYRDRPLALDLDWEWYSPEGEYATGSLQILNRTPNELVIPPGTVWRDEQNREYEVTEIKKIPPYNQTLLTLKAKQREFIDYEGKVKPREWFVNGSLDEDEAVILLQSPPQGTGFAWEEDEDEAHALLLDARISVRGGSKPNFGRYKGRAKQKNTLQWSFAPGDTLAGVRLFTERLSGYMFHEAKLIPTLLFWMEETVKIKPGSLVIDFEGIAWQEVSDGSPA